MVQTRSQWEKKHEVKQAHLEYLHDLKQKENKMDHFMLGKSRARGSQLSLRHFIWLPLAYGLLAYGCKRYWLENDLRHLYKEVLKPQHRRYSDEL